MDGGAEWLHFSIQDGVFVPKHALGAAVVSSVRKNVQDHVVLDVKLSTVDPIEHIASYAKAGADVISFHPEATQQPMAVVNAIHGKHKTVIAR